MGIRPLTAPSLALQTSIVLHPSSSLFFANLCIFALKAIASFRGGLPKTLGVELDDRQRLLPINDLRAMRRAGND